jgi:acetylxylan esterase
MPLMLSKIISAAFLALIAIGDAAKLEPVSSFGDNPTKLSMYIYVPDKLAANPPVIIVVRNFPRSTALRIQ